MYLIEPPKVGAKRRKIDQLKKIDNLADGNERAAVFDVLNYTFSRLPEEDLLIHWLARYTSWRLEELRQMPTRFDDLLSGEDSTFTTMLLRYVSSKALSMHSSSKMVKFCHDILYRRLKPVTANRVGEVTNFAFLLSRRTSWSTYCVIPSIGEEIGGSALASAQ